MDACTVVLARVTGEIQGLSQCTDKARMDFSGLVSTPAKAPNFPRPWRITVLVTLPARKTRPSGGFFRFNEKKLQHVFVFGNNSRFLLVF
jgi:hypothetical protein